MIRLRSEGVAWQVVDDEVVCLDLRTSRYLAVNPTGTQLWPLLTEGTRTEAMVDRLVEVFGIDRERAAEDATAFVKELSRHDLLEDA